MQVSLVLALAFLLFTRKYSVSPLQSAKIARSRESNLDSCRPMSLGSYRPANLLIRTDSEPEVRGSSVRSGIFFDSKQDMCLSRHDKFHTSSSKFRVRLGCRGCSGVKNHLLGCMYRIRPGMIFRAGTRYAPSHQFFHRPFYVTSLILIRKFPSSGFKADLDTILKEIL